MINVGIIKESLNGQLPSVCVSLLGEPNRTLSSKNTLRWGRHGSLSLEIAGPKKGQWFDHSEGVGGDVIRLIEHVKHIPFPEAVKFAGQYVNLETLPPCAPSPKAAPEAPKPIPPSVPRIWGQSEPITGTLAEAYLASRGLSTLEDLSHALRFHPRCPFGDAFAPALVASMCDVLTGELTGLHRTFLTADGQKMERRMAGRCGGAAVMLTPFEDVTHGLFIGEGIETCLSGFVAGWRPVWAVTSAGNMASFPVLGGIECLTLIADNDASGTGQKAAATCTERWRDAGRSTRTLLPEKTGQDLNDLWRAA